MVFPAGHRKARRAEYAVDPNGPVKPLLFPETDSHVHKVLHPGIHQYRPDPVSIHMIHLDAGSIVDAIPYINFYFQL